MRKIRIFFFALAGIRVFFCGETGGTGSAFDFGYGYDMAETGIKHAKNARDYLLFRILKCKIVTDSVKKRFSWKSRKARSVG